MRFLSHNPHHRNTERHRLSGRIQRCVAHFLYISRQLLSVYFYGEGLEEMRPCRSGRQVLFCYGFWQYGFDGILPLSNAARTPATVNTPNPKVSAAISIYWKPAREIC